MKRRAVFLDRDGVINKPLVRDGRPFPPARMSEFEFFPGVEGALDRLKAAGFLIIVATNQGDVARGVIRREAVEAMHDLIERKLPVDDIKVCFETEEKAPGFYKPGPGMLLEAAKDHRIDLGRSYMVGDRWRDIGAGRAAGCFTMFIDYGYCERQPETPDAVVPSLAAAAELILSRP